MSETSPGIQEQEVQKPLKDLMWEALDKNPGRVSVNESRQLQQKAVFDRLPGDFEMQMRGFIANAEFRKVANTPLVIYGEIFEYLVRADTNICPRQEVHEAELIRSILKDPGIYGLEEKGIDHSMRNPDVAQVDKSGRIVGAVEAKSARKLDRRAISQLSSFRHNLTELVSRLKKIDFATLKSHGLAVIAYNINKLDVDNSFRVTVALPFGIYNGDEASLLDKDEFTKPGQIESALNVLRKTRIAQSPFSKKEISILTKAVLDWANISQEPQPLTSESV